MTNELYHYGIKGQKWGVRRFENRDGSLTDAGKKRYNYSDKQRRQDARLYGRRANKRIQKRLENGESLVSARHAEVNRKNRREKIKKAAKLTSALAIPIVAPLTVSALMNRAQKKKSKELDDMMANSRESVKKMWSEFADRQKVKDDRAKKTMDQLNEILRKKPSRSTDPNRSPGKMSDRWKQILENTDRRDTERKSKFEKKMKEYWEREGREKWEKKNKRK